MPTKYVTTTASEFDSEAISEAMPDPFKHRPVALSEASTYEASGYGLALALQYVGLIALFVGGASLVLLLFWWTYLVPSCGPFFHRDHHHDAYAVA
ncbi:hypothetical protein SDRG_14824 [Saprolegnia diclina VS20]|uniref:Uncharacterized protein n=1 Tax=Saprolegnia diclina (strain VS20) TaxID=1156394 RepID=T0R5P8_SAPDV|nr:hypothetical protein SDRG_14824 [Saprolegnia diclina VS20]EQC27383.1 hypothetical protein SDRG_14824 [Saprolegnia diclina VS20]|eukprot:XP_008619202.1 hypothetical protein SDRG_14824 [Saprolegnia diclina VS20]